MRDIRNFVGPWSLGLGLCVAVAGCGDRIRQPTSEEVARFRAAEGTRPTVDMERVLQAKIVPGPYRAVAGDVLHIEMPRFPEQQAAATEADSRQTYNCRIEEDGTITLYLVGKLVVQGQSLAQIEAAIGAQYYPKYAATPLPVYVSVLEYRTEQVAVVGAVAQPGIHALRHDRMSLVAALNQAGGITAPGAAIIRINRAEGRGGGLEAEPVRDRPAAPRPRGQNIIPAHAAVPGQRTEDGRRPTAPSETWQVTFVRQGPLRTTGWLRVQQDNSDTAVRQWLDIANRPQRRTFLDVLTASSRELGTEALDAKLAQLGAYLEERALDRGPSTDVSSVVRPPSGATCPAELPAGWMSLNYGCFAMACGVARGGSSDGEFGLEGPGSAFNSVVAAPLPVRMVSAVGSARGDVPPAPRRYRVPPSAPPDPATPAVPRTDDRRQTTADGVVLRGPAPAPAPEGGVKQIPQDLAGPLRKAPALSSESWDPRGSSLSQFGVGAPTPGPAAADPRAGERAPNGATEPLGTRVPATQTLVLPVRGLNIPFADVTLEEGDTVVVEPPHEQMISIVGLVVHPGNMPAAPLGHYNLIQALAFAGGLDLVADPRYVSVYRLTPSGEIVSVTFQLVNPHHQQQLTDALALPLQPGDVVSVEHTLRTRTNVFLDRVFRMTFGFYIDPIRGGY